MTNQYYLTEWNKKYNTNIRLYDMDIVLTYVTLVPFVNRELGTNFEIEEKYKEQAEKIMPYKSVYGNYYHVPQRVTELRKWKYEDKWEMRLFSGICPTSWDHLTREDILDYLNALHSVLDEHPNIFFESFKNVMEYNPKYCYNYNEIMQGAIDHYKPFLNKEEMMKEIADSCNLVMANNRDFRGFNLLINAEK